MCEEILIKGLAPNPEDRFACIDEFDTALAKVINEINRRQMSFTEAAIDAERQFSGWRENNEKLYQVLAKNDEHIRMKLKDSDDEAEYYIEDLLDRLAEKDCCHAILTGDGGVGKTTTCMRILDVYKNQNKQFIYIPLREYNAVSHTLKRHINGVFKIDSDSDYKHMTEEENIVLLLDGFNEIAEYKDQFELLKELDTLRKNKYMQIIITSRDLNEITKPATIGFSKLTFEPVTNAFIDEWLEIA